MRRLAARNFKNVLGRRNLSSGASKPLHVARNGTMWGPMLQQPAVAYGKHQMNNDSFAASLQTMLRTGNFTQEQMDKIENVVRNRMGIDNRYFCQRPEDTWGLDIQQKTDLYTEKSVELLEVAVEQALQNAGIEGKDIDCIITTSGINLVFPQAPVQLTQRKPHLGFRNNIVHKIFPQVTCCSGGATTLREGIDYLSAHNTHNALLLNIELSSLMWDSAKMDPIDIFTRYALFGDAVTASVVFGTNSPHAKKTGVELIGGRQETVPDSCDAMYVTHSERGPSLQVTKQVPVLARAGMPAFATALSQDYFGVEPKDLPWTVIHPGGKKILHEVAEDLGVIGSPSHDLSKEHYRLAANIQSASVMDIMRIGWDQFQNNEDMILVAIGGWVLEGIAMRAHV